MLFLHVGFVLPVSAPCRGLVNTRSSVAGSAYGCTTTQEVASIYYCWPRSAVSPCERGSEETGCVPEGVCLSRSRQKKKHQVYRYRCLVTLFGSCLCLGDGAMVEELLTPPGCSSVFLWGTIRKPNPVLVGFCVRWLMFTLFCMSFFPTNG